MLYFSEFMRKFPGIVVLFAPLMFGQTLAPNLIGVWKADLTKSKFAGPAPTNYLELIEEKTVEIDHKTKEKGQEIDELSGSWGEHGEHRSLLAFVPNGKPYVRRYQGVPTRITASWQETTLNLAGEVAGGPQLIKRAYQ